MKPLVIANWKMNGALPAIEGFAEQWLSLGELDPAAVTTVLCPPFPYLSAVKSSLPEMELGAQDCSSHDAGAYTGEVGADMAVEVGCDWVILGHSERRQYHGETDALVAEKVARAQAAGLTAIVCVGEHLSQREAGDHEKVVAAQLEGSLDGADPKDLVVAYEPVWAIGTGVSASAEQANEMHRWIRDCLHNKFADDAAQVAVIYGGSVKPDTAGELFACDMINGALVGGASLKAESFHGIAKAAADSGRT